MIVRYFHIITSAYIPCADNGLPVNLDHISCNPKTRQHDMPNVRFLGYFRDLRHLKKRHNSNKYSILRKYYRFSVFGTRPRHRFFILRSLRECASPDPRPCRPRKDPFLYGFRSYIQFKLNPMPIRGFYGHGCPEAGLPFLLLGFISVPSH